jgi:lysophospholipase L1-like esterase
MLRLRPFGIQLANTFILLFIGLPLGSFLFSPSDELNLQPKLEDKPYAYEVAKRDPATFERWMRYLNIEVPKLFEAIFTSGGMPRTNVELTFIQSHILMNGKGFRGEEISDDKGNHYRIVALGESTTFGITMTSNDVPWPEILEQMIRDKLKPSRPVEVINAGLPAYSLQKNLDRLPTQILPLKPDMILSYHGFNGFSAVYNNMPPIQTMPPPRYHQRPLKLLADVEHHFRILAYRKRYSPRSTPAPAYASSPMESEYAREYRQLIEMTRTNGIHLLLATYSMAVNEHIDRDLVDFYRLTNTGVEWKIKANVAHNQIVEQLARENPDICFAETRPTFDGHHELFYDICHFTPEGEERMAKIMFDAIKDVLQKEIGGTNSAVQN